MRLIRRCSLKRAWLGSAWPPSTCWRQGWSTPPGPRAGGRPWPTCPHVRNGPQGRAGRHPAHALRLTRRHLTMTDAVSVSALVKTFGRTRPHEAGAHPLQGQSAESDPGSLGGSAERRSRTAGRDALIPSLAGTGALIRLILRRDRLLLALFIALPVLIAASQAIALHELYPTAEARRIFTQQSNGNPA